MPPQPADPRPSATDRTPPAKLVDIRREDWPSTARPFSITRVVVALAIAIWGILLVILAAVMLKLGAWVLAPVVAVVVGYVVREIVINQRNRRRAALCCSAYCGDVRTVISKALKLGRNPADFPQIMTPIARGLSRAGCTNTAIRVGPAAALRQLSPLTVEFEPLPFDETDDTLLQLANVGGADPAVERLLDDPINRTDNAVMRRLQRALRSQWVVLLIYAPLFIRGAWRWFVTGRPNWQALAFGVLILIMLLGPAMLGNSRNRRYLLVPGGLIRRRAGPGGHGWRVHLFDRRAAICCAFPINKLQWLVHVADSEQSDFLLATPRETDLLLRAWLSPLTPPPVERLSDLR